jgi:hypothetical protein
MAKEEYEMPQSESDVGSESGEVDRKSDKVIMKANMMMMVMMVMIMRMMMIMSHCGKETGHIVYLMKCPRCSWKDFYWSKDAQCMICNEQSPLLFPHVIVSASYVRMVRLPTRQVEWSSHQKATNKRPSRLDRT